MTLQRGILTWTRGLNHDHEGGSSRARLLHCTKEWLTPAISPNVGNSTSSFLLVGICVRANPCNFGPVMCDLIDRKAYRSWPNLSSATLTSTSESHGRWHHPLNLCSLFLCNSVLGQQNQVGFDLLHLRRFSLIPISFGAFLVELKRCT